MNVGAIDRVVRLALGVLLIGLSFLPSGNPLIDAPGIWKWVIIAVGFVMLATAAFRFCPAYKLVGVNTCSR